VNSQASFLQLKQISKKYNDRLVLSDISFDQSAHEIICLLGESGSGKTTTLMLIAGIEQPDEGEIWIGGEKQSARDKFVPPEKRNVGFVFQDYALFPHLSVGRNVSFGIRGLRRPARKARALAELKRLGMETYIDSYPHQLSGGERQRVALARALAADPRILLLDEPFASLDKQWREYLREETIGLLRQRGSSCIFVTHDPEEACYVADRIILIDEGKILQQGSAAVLYNAPLSLKAMQFFGKVNAFQAQVIQGAARLEKGNDFALPLADSRFSEGQRVMVAFRPEAVSLAPEGLALNTTTIETHFLGKITEFSLQLGAQSLTAQVMGKPPAAPHQFYLDPKAVHLFSV
jgi:iron(III) transport system ATP-binding protein